MWFLKLFIGLIGLGLIYMVVTQETITMGRPGHYNNWSLWTHPVRFLVTFTIFIGVEWFLIKVYLAAEKEEHEKKQKKSRNRRTNKDKRL